ncbi:MAG TPA: lysophospholipid acyltransferase family protein [Gemmatimonadales bacterium]
MTAFLALLGRAALGLLALTWRIELDGVDHLRRMRATGRGFVFGSWHRGMVPLIWHHRGEGVTLLISQHRDGEWLSAAVKRWGYRVVRGSSTRGGMSGLRGLVRTLRSGGEVAVTADGPRGPARVPKPGTVAAARHVSAPILPVAAAASRAWLVRSWDALMVPQPFARVRIVYGAPFEVYDPADDGGRLLADRLDAAAARAEGEGRGRGGR